MKKKADKKKKKNEETEYKRTAQTPGEPQQAIQTQTHKGARTHTHAQCTYTSTGAEDVCALESVLFGFLPSPKFTTHRHMTPASPLSCAPTFVSRSAMCTSTSLPSTSSAISPFLLARPRSSSSSFVWSFCTGCSEDAVYDVVNGTTPSRETKATTEGSKRASE